MEKVKKIIGISLIAFCLIYFILYALYMNGVFIKEKFSGIIVSGLMINNETIEFDSNNKKQISLSLSENEKYYIRLYCGWKYEYKYYENRLNLPEVKYKEINYTIMKDNNIYFGDQNNEEITKKYGTCMDYTDFYFQFNEPGIYEVIIDLYIYINYENCCQSKTIVFIVE